MDFSYSDTINTFQFFHCFYFKINFDSFGGLKKNKYIFISEMT
jgi:hypothetical protein